MDDAGRTVLAIDSGIGWCYHMAGRCDELWQVTHDRVFVKCCVWATLATSYIKVVIKLINICNRGSQQALGH